LDRKAFQAMTAEEADNFQRDYSKESIKKRLNVEFYLTRVAYDFDIDNPPRMDKSVFSAK
jgi:hypothetical protein